MSHARAVSRRAELVRMQSRRDFSGDHEPSMQLRYSSHLLLAVPRPVKEIFLSHHPPWYRNARSKGGGGADIMDNFWTSGRKEQERENASCKVLPGEADWR